MCWGYFTDFTFIIDNLNHPITSLHLSLLLLFTIITPPPPSSPSPTQDFSTFHHHRFSSTSITNATQSSPLLPLLFHNTPRHFQTTAKGRLTRLTPASSFSQFSFTHSLHSQHLSLSYWKKNYTTPLNLLGQSNICSATKRQDATLLHAAGLLKLKSLV